MCYYPVDISTTVFSYSCAVQYHSILHVCGYYWTHVIGRTLGLRKGLYLHVYIYIYTVKKRSLLCGSYWSCKSHPLQRLWCTTNVLNSAMVAYPGSPLASVCKYEARWLRDQVNSEVLDDGRVCLKWDQLEYIWH